MTRAIHVVMDCDDVVVKAFTSLDAAEAFVAGDPRADTIITVPLDALEDEDAA